MCGDSRLVGASPGPTLIGGGWSGWEEGGWVCDATGAPPPVAMVTRPAAGGRPMAMLGVTQLGYRDPFGGRLRRPARDKLRRADSNPSEDVCKVRGRPKLAVGPEVADPYVRTTEQCLEETYFGKLPPICDTSIPLPEVPYHERSVEKFTLLKRLGSLPKAPNLIYREPLTTSQLYGWWLPPDPGEKLETKEPWTRSTRYPLVQSEMTRFVNRMMLTDPGFWLY
ncbi:uncharacterized protein LOC127566885 [Pristis pectinata]|uniref:uncharacterized protein LOC127566885 n=1 Tax=Pristis pectinata TaxID=685728 RepID=UPI00223DD1F1|nr:uncharacterized protein LOC127566885 [Pristis pectinata]